LSCVIWLYDAPTVAFKVVRKMAPGEIKRRMFQGGCFCRVREDACSLGVGGVDVFRGFSSLLMERGMCEQGMGRSVPVVTLPR
jgi:hypothetical protein